MLVDPMDEIFYFSIFIIIFKDTLKKICVQLVTITMLWTWFFYPIPQFVSYYTLIFQ